MTPKELRDLEKEKCDCRCGKQTQRLIEEIRLLQKDREIWHMKYLSARADRQVDRRMHFIKGRMALCGMDSKDRTDDPKKVDCLRCIMFLNK